MRPTRGVRTAVFVIGAAKAGTTWLHSLCERHPGIATPTVKETNYFAHRFDRGPTYYEGLFAGREGVRVDNSPSYLPDSAAALRIRDYNPEARLVVILRNALERALSHYEMLYNNGALTGRLSVDLARDSRIVQDSLYGTHLSRWVELFGAKPIEVLYFEDVRANPQELWRQFCVHVGVEAITIPEIDRAVNARRGRPRSLGFYRTLVDTVGRFDGLTRLLRSSALRPLRRTYHRVMFAADTAASRDLPGSERKRLAELFNEDLERVPPELGVSARRMVALRSVT